MNQVNVFILNTKRQLCNYKKLETNVILILRCKKVSPFSSLLPLPSFLVTPPPSLRRISLSFPATPLRSKPPQLIWRLKLVQNSL